MSQNKQEEFCPCSRKDKHAGGLPLWLPMILLNFPFILSGDLQTKSWGLAVVLLRICVCSKVVVGEGGFHSRTTQLVNISSRTQLSNHPRLTLFSGVSTWGCLLIINFTLKHPFAGSTMVLDYKCNYSAFHPWSILLHIHTIKCGTWWQKQLLLHHGVIFYAWNHTKWSTDMTSLTEQD